MIIPDINLLVYAYNKLAPHHIQAKKWWETMLSEETLVGIPWAVTFGFVRLMTHRQVLVDPVPVQICCSMVEEWYERPNVQPLDPAQTPFHFQRVLVFNGSGWKSCYGCPHCGTRS